MLFWIFMPCNIFVLLILHFSMGGCEKPNGNIVLGVKIPTMYLNDLGVDAIVKEYKKNRGKMFWILLVLQFLGYPFRGLISISLVWMFVYLFGVIAIYGYYIEYYARKLRALKKESGWIMAGGHILNIDMEVSRLKKTFPMSRKWFILPLLWMIPSVVIPMRDTDVILLLPVFVIMIASYLVGIICYAISMSMAMVVYSENSEVNVALNKADKSAWSKAWIFVSYTSLLFVPFAFLIDNESGYNQTYMIYIFVMVALSTATGVIPMFVVHHRLSKLHTKLLQVELEPICVDDDEYWTTFSYNNPYDKKVFVTKRIGIGSTVNMATTGGKAFVYGMLSFTALIIIWCIWVTIPIDFEVVEMVQQGEIYEIGITGQMYELDSTEIVAVSYIEEMPSAYKNVGSATDRIKAGLFKVEDYGQSQVYVMNNVPLYIMVELEDGSYVFLNGKDVETTENYYEILRGI